MCHTFRDTMWCRAVAVPCLAVTNDRMTRSVDIIDDQADARAVKFRQRSPAIFSLSVSLSAPLSQASELSRKTTPLRAGLRCALVAPHRMSSSCIFPCRTARIVVFIGRFVSFRVFLLVFLFRFVFFLPDISFRFEIVSVFRRMISVLSLFLCLFSRGPRSLESSHCYAIFFA